MFNSKICLFAHFWDILLKIKHFFFKFILIKFSFFSTFSCIAFSFTFLSVDFWYLLTNLSDLFFFDIIKTVYLSLFSIPISKAFVWAISNSSSKQLTLIFFWWLSFKSPGVIYNCYSFNILDGYTVSNSHRWSLCFLPIY